MTLSHPVYFAIGIILTAVTSPLIYKRGAHSWLMLCGLLLLSLAAGGPAAVLHPSKQITAMVDLSPSTRGATFRDRAALLRRISELAGNLPVHLISFSDHLQELSSETVLPDLPCERTRYDPPAADAILLFSDGRFALPDAGAPTYPVIDPMLIDPPDAAVTRMQLDGQILTTTVQNYGAPRELTWQGTTTSEPTSIANGSSIIRNNNAVGPSIGARLNAGDHWPENDSLSLLTPPPVKLAYWWIGEGAPSDKWTSLAPAQLPTNPVEYLAPAVIAISNVSAEELSDTQQQRLFEYVHDLGGSLLIFGGDRAFSAGGFSGTTIDSLSPLASDPPTPTTHWILLADSSGSMAESVNGESRWSAAVDATVRMLPSIPATDLVSVGSFARDLTWWVENESASVAAKITAAPTKIAPNGPTNLQPILSQLALRKDALPVEVFLLTDADTTIENPQSLAASLKAARVRVSLLALGHVPDDNAVIQIVKGTGGHWSANKDPNQWIESLRRLMQAASPSRLENTPVQLHFAQAVHLPDRPLNTWNRTWFKTNAEQLAWNAGPVPDVALGARWQVGLGSVNAFAFAPTAAELNALATDWVQLPSDPRFKVTWECEQTTKVTVDATNEGTYLNGLNFVFDLAGDTPEPLRQIAPGRYTLEMPAIRTASQAVIVLNGHVIDRRAISGRYASEFNALGIDDSALSELASRTGGQLIAPSQHTPIQFAWPPKEVLLDSFIAIAGASLLAISFGRLRKRAT